MDKNLKIIVNQYPPWMILSKTDPNHCEGVSCEIIKYLSRSINFTYQFVHQNGIDTGQQLENGTWTGSIGLIQSGVSRYLFN